MMGTSEAKPVFTAGMAHDNAFSTEAGIDALLAFRQISMPGPVHFKQR